MATYKRWRDIRGKGKSPERMAQIARDVEKELVEMDLRELREVLGKTQAEMAEALKMSQSEVSRLERREDTLMSTLRRVVEALGGELQVVATFGDRAVRLRAAG
ncbi:MAG: helix-turn-helix transcriptional regulator [bacterium]|nr:helix-turn-helix transcriptional regulator [bacterium]